MQPSHAWVDLPERSPDGFRMASPDVDDSRVAVCEVWTHPEGWELRFTMDGASRPITKVVRSATAMRALVETWRGVLSAEGWSEELERKPTRAPSVPARPTRHPDA
jgi:hypothetical protein